MNNHFDERIKLRAVTTTNVGGFPQTYISETSIWADKKSVKRTEYYQAAAAGKKIDVVLAVNAIDFNDQTELEYNNAIYNIERTYQVKNDIVELSCVRR